MFKILVVDDDKELNESICEYLRENGFEAAGCADAGTAYNAMYDGMFDMVISDTGASDSEGFELAKNIRAQSTELPIILISSKNDLELKRHGYTLGIDDYIAKPIVPEELVLRMNAVFRRAGLSESKRIAMGNLILDADERVASYKGEEIPLTTREFNIIYKMLSNPKRTFSRAQLMNEFWSADSKSGTRTVDVYMTKLRDKFAKCREFEILTVHGVGYKAVIKQS